MHYLSTLLETSQGLICLVGSGGKTTLMFKLANYLASKEKRVLTTTTTKIRPPNHTQSPFLECVSDPLQWLRNRLQSCPCKHISLAASFDKKNNKLLGYHPKSIDRIWEEDFFDWIIVEADGAAQRPLKAPGSREPVLCSKSSHVIALVGLEGIDKRLNTENVFRVKEYADLSGLRPEESINPSAAADVIVSPQGLFKGIPEQAQAIACLNKVDKCPSTGYRLKQLLLAQGYRTVLGSLNKNYFK